MAGSAITLNAGLATMRMNPSEGTTSYCPPLGTLAPERIHPPAAFVDWWEDPVLTDADGASYSRKQLVLWVANKDGRSLSSPVRRFGVEFSERPPSYRPAC